MGLLFVDSFAHYSESQILRKWYDSFGTPSIYTTSSRRPGVPYLEIGSLGSTPRWIEKDLPTTPTTVVCGFAVRIVDSLIDSHWGFQLRRSGSPQCTVVINDDFTISVARGAYNGTVLGTSTFALSANTWHYLEFDIDVHDSTGTYTVDVDEDTVLLGSGVDTQGAATSGVDALRLYGCHTYSDADIDICDLYIADDAMRGDSRVDLLLPSGSGNYAQWTPSAGSNYANVDDDGTIDDDTTYNESDTVDQIDSFAFDDLEATGGTIHAVCVTTACKKTDSGSRGLTPLLRVSSTDYLATEHTLTDTYKCPQRIWEANPNTSSAWNEAGVNGLEAGYKLTT